MTYLGGVTGNVFRNQNCLCSYLLILSPFVGRWMLVAFRWGDFKSAFSPIEAKFVNIYWVCHFSENVCQLKDRSFCVWSRSPVIVSKHWFFSTSSSSPRAAFSFHDTRINCFNSGLWLSNSHATVNQLSFRAVFWGPGSRKSGWARSQEMGWDVERDRYKGTRALPLQKRIALSPKHFYDIHARNEAFYTLCRTFGGTC